MAIMQNGKDITQDLMDRVKALQKGPHGRKEALDIFAILTTAITTIDKIPRPWLNDFVYDTQLELVKLRDKIANS